MQHGLQLKTYRPNAAKVRRNPVVDSTAVDHKPARLIRTLILCGLLAGCAAGPDFKPPAAPLGPGYTAVPLPPQTASAPTALGNAQLFGARADVDAQWWQSLGSPRLDELIKHALENNPGLASARATLQQAQEIYSAQSRSTLYPEINAGVGAERQRFNPIVLGQSSNAREFSLYNASVSVRYKLDLAGGNRRALEALAARADYRRYELEGALLTVTANIVTTAVAHASIAGQIQSTEATLRAKEEQLHLTRERVRFGQAAADEVLNIQIQVEQTRAELPLLLKQLQQNKHLLAVFAGMEPGARDIPDFTLEEFTLPSDLPLILPSELVRHRPDILAAEALLHAANAEYGVAVASLYPQLNISASHGSQALSAGALFGEGSAVWSLIGQLTQPLFNPGLPAEKRASLAAFDAAAANYQGVVLE
ncbi:MAG: efflux transporter outer membrane subunit, partial [Halioglobus sp.]|nr:efflux transporter outer membrane subunit [Halioglobus sp.]